MRVSALLWLVIFIAAGFSESVFSQDADRRETFAKAYALYAAGNFSQAQELFEKTHDFQYLLADYSLYYSARIAFNQKNWDLSRRFLSQLRQHYPRSIWLQHTELLRAKIYLAEKDYSQGIAALGSLRALNGVRSEIADEAIYLQAQATESQGDVIQAYSLYQELRRTYPHSSWIPAARKDQGNKGKNCEPKSDRRGNAILVDAGKLQIALEQILLQF